MWDHVLNAQVRGLRSNAEGALSCPGVFLLICSLISFSDSARSAADNAFSQKTMGK